MHKWQYLVVIFVTADRGRMELSQMSDGSLEDQRDTKMADILNLKGSEGWELVSQSSSIAPTLNSYVANLILIFKRPLLDALDIMQSMV
jgi:hypothetical protein